MKKTGCRAVLAVLFLLTASALGGCSQEPEEEPWVPPQSAFQAPKDGPVTETLVETLEEDYYDSAELETMVKDAVSEYDQGKGNEAVQVVSFASEGREVRLVMDYHDMKTYNDFNKVKLFNGSILEAQMEGFLFDQEFYHVCAGEIDSDPLPGTIPVARKQYQVFVSDLVHAVEVPGDIVYVTTNAQLLGERIAAPAPMEEEEAADRYYYVIYEF